MQCLSVAECGDGDLLALPLVVFDGVIKNIQNYGKDAILVIGDWQKDKMLKGNTPIPMVNLRRKLKQYFKVYNFDEYRTSKLHYLTEEVCQYKKDKNEKL